MKKLILATIALVISLGINSQNQAQCTGHQQGKRCNIERNSVQSPKVKATMRVNKIAEAVELTNNERTKLFELFVDHFNKVKNNENVDRQSMRTEISNGIVAIIGQERYDKFREQQKLNNQKNHNKPTKPIVMAK